MKYSAIFLPFLLFSALALVAVGCGKDDKEGGGTKADPAAKSSGTKTKAGGAAARIQAKKIFKSRCAQCHGETGKGDGPSAATLDPKPRDYTDAAWQKTVTDDYLREVIVKGGAAVGKAATMTPNPDLGQPDKKAVLDEVVKIIRGFAG